MANNIIVLLVMEISTLPKNNFCKIEILNCSSGLKIIDYLSISPKTISCVPIMVTTSAIICPFDIEFKD